MCADYVDGRGANRRTYSDHVEVAWDLTSQTRFAFHGDCGALYCVKRGAKYVPIAIHRISSETSSFGSNFIEALQFISAEMDGEELSFVNPEFLFPSI